VPFDPLPILDAPPSPPTPAPERRWRSAGIYVLRLAMLAGIVWSMHHAQQRRTTARQAGPAPEIPLAVVRQLLPEAAALTPGPDGEVLIHDDSGQLRGSCLQTSPQADRIVGFSGPTNVLIVLDPDGVIVGVRILSSRDTREHAAQVANDPRFLPSYRGRSREAAADGGRLDAVSGATLTSLAIAEGIALRLGGAARSLRFPEPLAAADAAPLFPEAARVEPIPEIVGLWSVLDADGDELGRLLRTSPAADNVVGYQGPTEALVGLRRLAASAQPAAAPPAAAPPAAAPPAEPIAGPLTSAADSDEQPWAISGVRLGRSYDNEPYVGYVRDDRYYFRMFHGRTLTYLAALDLKAEGVEGVSGATMTSLAVAQGLVAAAQACVRDQERARSAQAAQRLQVRGRDVGTVLLTLAGVVIGLTSLRGRRWLRLTFLATAVIGLGFVNADLVSQALLVGWTQNGVRWRTMLGPLCLVGTALLLPVATQQNVYCAHLCPHGAAQQLLRAWSPWRMSPGSRWRPLLGAVPGLLLLAVVFIACGGWGVSLVDLEPFDAYVPAIAGWPALALFALGLTASLFVPMAYCQYGCPTGGLLNYLRRPGGRARLSGADALAALALALAAALSRW